MQETVRKWVGQPVVRLEDGELVRGDAKYLDDLEVEGQLHMRVVRSTVARAVIKSVDTTYASQMEGVVAVYTAKDFVGMFAPLLASGAPGTTVWDGSMSVIADGSVNYVGEPVAVVIAASRVLAEDAAEMVDITYERLPAVVDPYASLDGGVLLHEGLPNNILISWGKTSDNFEGAMSQASKIVEGFFELPRVVAAPMEPRGCLVSYDGSADAVMLWASTQDPHRPQAQIAQVFGLAVDRVRVIVPEVGGAFGSKGGAPQEYILACASSKKLGRAIKWVEDRSENFISSYQGRGISARVRLGLDETGRFVAIEADLLADLGAYLFPSTPIAPVTAATLMTGAYTIPSVKVTMNGVATNKVPTGPYRGAGRPEACFFVEQIVDIAAREMGIDPLDIRLRNLISPDSFPYQTPLGPIYDSGNYAPTLNRVSELLREQGSTGSSKVREGWLSSKGIAMSVEPAGGGFWESGGIKVLGDGMVVATSGSSSHGQGHKTSFAQIIADELGVELEQILVRQGDSADGGGIGTFGSRSMLLGGEALVIASKQVKDIAAQWASSFLEASIEDLVWDGNGVHVQGSPLPRVTLAEIARQMEESDPNLSLEAQARSRIPSPAYPFGAYGAEIEIEISTGVIELKRIIAVDDAGLIINPLLAEGQVIGATLQGVASALLEEMVYDNDGIPLSSSFVDYLIPGSGESDFASQNEFRSTPTPYTSLGAKGIGESGTVGALAAIANAVNGCLAGKGSRKPINPPYSPQKLWGVLKLL
ncbi:MAG: xanthine dehydrogenase family protein molybdopterin-binding subunit [Acidimicrobiaceae bacterium]|nr:xanthine dehydrogenase family protein molybdopterin-binding subunit [Acidimicrobiaceae bacterium]